MSFPRLWNHKRCNFAILIDYEIHTCWRPKIKLLRLPSSGPQSSAWGFPFSSHTHTQYYILVISLAPRGQWLCLPRFLHLYMTWSTTLSIRGKTLLDHKCFFCFFFLSPHRSIDDPVNDLMKMHKRLAEPIIIYRSEGRKWIIHVQVWWLRAKSQALPGRSLSDKIIFYYLTFSSCRSFPGFILTLGSFIAEPLLITLILNISSITVTP